MSGLGTFDQTGSIGDSLKGGALTYGLGQGARYLGGAGFQGNPFSADGGAFRGGLEGLKGGFSSPLGNQTGFKLGKPVQEVQGVGDNTILPKQKPTNLLSEQMSEVSLSPSGSVVTSDSILTSPSGSGSAMDSFKSIVSFDTSAGQKTDAALDLLKRGSKALFTKSDGKGGTVIDKAAVIGAVTAAASYAEAKALAADAGIDLTEEEYDESLRDEKKAEYAGYLQNFFGGKKDGGRIGFNDGSDPGDIVLASDSNDDLIKSGKFARVVRVLMDEGFDFAEAVKEAMRQGYNQGGRIGFESGANEMIKTQLLEEIMPNTDTTTEDYIVIMTEDGPRMILKSELPSESMMMDTTTSAYGDAGRGRPVPKFADGGRIGFKRGSPEETSEIGIMSIDVEAGGDEDEEDMMMAGITFSRPEKSYLFRRLGGSGGADRSFTMPQLYRILNNPNRYPDDAAVLKEIAIMGMKKDGGRIEFRDGSSTGNFGADRYASELVEAYESLLNKGDLFLTDVEKELLEKGEYPSPDKMKELTTRYENLEKEYEQGENKFDNINLQDSLFDKDALKYYNKKIKDLENREERLMDKEEKINEVMYTDLDVSSILKTPAFQEWYSLWKVKNPKADDLPNAEYFENMMFDTKRLRPDFMKTKYDSEMKAKGGRIGYKGGANRVSELLILRDELIGKGEDVSDIEAEIFQLTGKTFRSVGGISDIPTGKMRKNNAGVVERDYRDEGGFVPVGIKERADDVPAMLSKNEFVMTADAVRGIGNGSVEEGSKKLYNTMKQAEKVGKA